MVVRKWWQLIGGLWFVLYGLLAVTSFNFAAAGVVMGVLAAIVGGLLLLDR